MLLDLDANEGLEGETLAIMLDELGNGPLPLSIERLFTSRLTSLRLKVVVCIKMEIALSTASLIPIAVIPDPLPRLGQCSRTAMDVD
jgi:hypothetical protein